MSAWVTQEWTDEGGKRRRELVTDLRASRSLVRADAAFVVEWMVNGRRKRKKIRQRGPDGKREAIELMKRIDTGTAPETSDATWKGAKQRFIETVLPTKRAEGTREVIRLALQRFEDLVAPTRLTAITAETIDTFAARLLALDVRGGGKMRATSVNRHLRVIKLFLRKMYDWGLIQRVPKVAMLDEEPEPRPVLTAAQFSAMYKAADHARLPTGIGTCPIGLWWRAAMLLYFETGVRRSELLSLRWENVDFERRQFTLEASGTKGRRLRVCSFSEVSERNLLAMREHATGPCVFVWTAEISNLNREWNRIKKAAGLPDIKHLGPHSARRAVGNIVTELYGLDVAQSKLGHASSATTRKHYAEAAMRSKTAAAAVPLPADLLQAERTSG